MRIPDIAAILERNMPYQQEGTEMSIRDKIKGMMKGHEGQARQGVDKGGDMVDRKTGNKYKGQVDTAQRKLNEQLGTDREDPPRQT
jgi:hypothetical protein